MWGVDVLVSGGVGGFGECRSLDYRTSVDSPSSTGSTEAECTPPLPAPPPTPG
jgi:hypothetical protein